MSWAQKLTHLSLRCNRYKDEFGALDGLLPRLISLTDLDTDPQTFSPTAILRMKSLLQRLNLGGWVSMFIEELSRGLEAEHPEDGDLALPQLNFVNARIVDGPRAPIIDEQDGLIMKGCMNVFHNRDIFIERIT